MMRTHQTFDPALILAALSRLAAGDDRARGRAELWQETDIIGGPFDDTDTVQDSCNPDTLPDGFDEEMFPMEETFSHRRRTIFDREK
jgi:hypothetical protein